jgi:plastocyanin
MTGDMQLKAIQAAMIQYRTGKLSRRQFTSRVSALGLGAAAVALLGRRAAAQEGTPSAPPAATPGINPDGTRTWKVMAGAMWMEGAMGEISAFLPGTITINAGDTIIFEVMGFHNVAFTSGAEVPPLIIPSDPPLDLIATPPAAGAGQPQLVINPAVVFPSGGPTYDGTGVVNSGLPFDPSAPPFTLTFTAPGEYDYSCFVHQPHMNGKVIVQEAGSPLPMEQDGVDAQAQTELAAFIETAKALLGSTATPAAAGVAEVLIAPGQEHVELLTYLPQEVTIKAGETVRWTYAGSMSPHTVTFLGGEAPIEDLVPVGGEAGPPAITINPNSFFPSDSASQPYSGAGIVNSGWLGPFPGMAQSFEIVFAAPGEYGYYCILHAGSPDEDPTMSMVGKVIVAE